MVITEKVESKEDNGAEPTVQQRKVTAYDCILSKEPLDTSDPGYQAPKPPEEPITHRPQVQRRGGRGAVRHKHNETESRQDRRD